MNRGADFVKPLALALCARTRSLTFLLQLEGIFDSIPIVTD